MIGYSLVLSTPVIQIETQGAEPTVLADLTTVASDWRRTIRLQGGFWDGSFSLPLTAEARYGFDTWMGAHVVERSDGVISWEGFIYEMELSENGLVQRRSFDDMCNKDRSNYQELDGGEEETDWATNDLSILSYGTKECVLDVETDFSDLAELARDTYLAEHGWPWPRPVSFSNPQDAKLTVSCCGYVFTLNWKYLSSGDCGVAGDSDTPACDVYEDSGSYDFVNNEWDDVTVDWRLYQGKNFDEPDPDPNDPATWARCSIYWDTTDGPCWAYLGEAVDTGGGTWNSVKCFSDPQLATAGYNGTFGVVNDPYHIRHDTSTWIALIVDTDSEFLETGNIDTNHVQVYRSDGNRAGIGGKKGWEAISYAASLGGWDYLPWRAWVGPNRRVNFRPIVPEEKGNPIPIVSSTDTTPIVVTATAHGLNTGDKVRITGHLVNTNANAVWYITKVDADSFSLDDSTATGGGAGGATGNIFHITQAQPRYLYRHGEWLNTDGGKANPWLLQPGVVRHTDWRFGTKRDGYWLEDPRDILVEEIEVNAQGSVTPRILNVNQEEMLLYQLETYPNRGPLMTGGDEAGPGGTGMWWFNPETGEWAWHWYGSGQVPWPWIPTQGGPRGSAPG